MMDQKQVSSSAPNKISSSIFSSQNPNKENDLDFAKKRGVKRVLREEGLNNQLLDQSNQPEPPLKKTPSKKRLHDDGLNKEVIIEQTNHPVPPVSPKKGSGVKRLIPQGFTNNVILPISSTKNSQSITKPITTRVKRIVSHPINKGVLPNLEEIDNSESKTNIKQDSIAQEQKSHTSTANESQPPSKSSSVSSNKSIISNSANSLRQKVADRNKESRVFSSGGPAIPDNGSVRVDIKEKKSLTKTPKAKKDFWATADKNAPKDSTSSESPHPNRMLKTAQANGKALLMSGKALVTTAKEGIKKTSKNNSVKQDVSKQLDEDTSLHDTLLEKNNETIIQRAETFDVHLDAEVELDNFQPELPVEQDEENIIISKQYPLEESYIPENAVECAQKSIKDHEESTGLIANNITNDLVKNEDVPNEEVCSNQDIQGETVNDYPLEDTSEEHINGTNEGEIKENDEMPLQTCNNDTQICTSNSEDELETSENVCQDMTEERGRIPEKEEEELLTSQVPILKDDLIPQEKGTIPEGTNHKLQTQELTESDYIMEPDEHLTVTEEKETNEVNVKETNEENYKETEEATNKFETQDVILDSVEMSSLKEESNVEDVIEPGKKANEVDETQANSWKDEQEEKTQEFLIDVKDDIKQTSEMTKDDMLVVCDEPVAENAEATYVSETKETIGEVQSNPEGQNSEIVVGLCSKSNNGNDDCLANPEDEGKEQSNVKEDLTNVSSIDEIIQNLTNFEAEHKKTLQTAQEDEENMPATNYDAQDDDMSDHSTAAVTSQENKVVPPEMGDQHVQSHSDQPALTPDVIG